MKDLVSYGDSCSISRLGAIELVEPKECIAEITELDTLSALDTYFSSNGDRLFVVLNGLFIVSLCLVDVSDISKLTSLKSLVADFSNNGE